MSAAVGEWLLPDTLDPSLPGLARTLAPAEVAERFREGRPELVGDHDITSCTPEHLRWSPGEECVATYRIELIESSGNRATTFGAVAAGTRGVQRWLCTADGRLAGIAAATDRVLMTDWLGARLARRVDIDSIDVIRYRPGERCVIRYTIDDAHTRLYGKVLAGDRCGETAAVMNALGPGLAAALVGVAPEWQLVVLRDAGRHSLRDVPLHDRSQYGAAGRLLAELHRRTGPPGTVRSLGDDARALNRYLPMVERISGSGAALFTRGLAALAAVEDGSPAPSVPSHGAFRRDQVQLGAAGPRLIDLDTFCTAERERDAGNLIAYLDWRVIRGADARQAIADAKDAFLSGYSASSDAPLNTERLRLFEAATLLKIAGRCFRGLRVDQWQRTPQLMTAALDRLHADHGSPR